MLQMTTPAPPVAGTSAAALCANCGAPLVGPYCAQCGQKAAHRIASLRRIIVETLEDQLQLDAALPRTLGALVAHPGKLTREYIAGRVMSYIPPIRLYLAVSVVFFLLFALLPERSIVQMNVSDTAAGGAVPAGPGAGADLSAAARNSVHISFQSGPFDKIRRSEAHMPTLLASAVDRFLRHIKRLMAMNPQDRSRVMAARFADAAPKVVFLMLPVFAALLKLLYLRRQRLYVEHFVFSLHVHALAFLAFTPLLFLRSVPWVKGLVYLALLFYLFRAMRVVYEQGRARTAVKLSLLGMSYLVVVAVGMATASVIAIMEL